MHKKTESLFGQEFDEDMKASHILIETEKEEKYVLKKLNDSADFAS